MPYESSSKVRGIAVGVLVLVFAFLAAVPVVLWLIARN